MIKTEIQCNCIYINLNGDYSIYRDKIVCIPDTIFIRVLASNV